ncbi:MAG: hypothetical protein ACPG49_07130 [Chitinophagales bacterium]
MGIIQDLYETLGNHYTKEKLDKGWKPLIDNFLSKNTALCLSEGMSDKLVEKIAAKRINKGDLMDLCCVPFLSRTLFEAFQKTLPKDLVKVLGELAWVKELHENEIKKRLEVEISELVPTRYDWGSDTYELKKMYYFFRVDSNRGQSRNHTLSLPPLFRKRLADFFPKPKNSDIHPTTPKKTDFTYNGEQDIFLELPRLLAYQGQGNIKLTKKLRPILSGMSKMQRTLNIQEFFEDTKDRALKNLRTNAIAGILTTCNHITEKEPPKLIKAFFKQYQKSSYNSLALLLTHVKGTGHLDHWNTIHIEDVFVDILKELPLGEWVDFKNIEDFAKYRMLGIVPVRKSIAGQKLYVNKKEKYDNKRYIKGDIFNAIIPQSLLRANFFLFAAFGLVEIAYDTPDTTEIVTTYFSPYDGIRYAKITDLGAYVSSDYKTDYTPPETVQKTPLVLSEDSLMVLSDDTDVTADILLQNYTQKVGPNRYQTDAAIFLKDCRSVKDIEYKVDLFHQTVTNKLPANWKAFFDGLLANTNPFENVSSKYIIFKIPPTNRELIQLVVQDAILKKYVQKAEGFHFLVLKTHLSKFKNRLKEFGFFLS